MSEATEHLEALSKELVSLESVPTAEGLDAMFRHAHSVKGMASSMGFDSTARLAHRLEDLLDVLRGDVARFDKEVGDLVLSAVDLLMAHVRAAASALPMPDASEPVEKLQAAIARLKGQAASGITPAPVTSSDSGVVTTPMQQAPPSSPPSQAAYPAEPAPPDEGEGALPPRLRLTVRVSPGAAQPGVRGFLVYKRLSAAGNIFDLKPTIEDIKAGRMPQGLITFDYETAQSRDEVERTLRTIADVELEKVEAVALSRASAPAKKAEPEAPRPVGQEPARTVRVRTELLDQFVDAAGELVLATARVREVGKAVPEPARPAFDEAMDQLRSLVRDLHEKVMQARMTPISVVTDRLPRAARDIARRRGRDVELSIEGADIELDRAIVDELADPVLHLLRNAIDHGIEPPEERRMRGKEPRGTLKVEVRRLRDRVVVELTDDGRGIDVERLKSLAVERGLLTNDDAQALPERDAVMLCCLPGLSTAADVTDVSGRGVGMDAVKRAIESVGGALEIDSTRGQGTRFRLSLPLTVAMVHLLLVGVGDEVYGLPIAKVSGVVETPRSSLDHSENAPVLHFGQNVVPVHELGQLLEIPHNGVDAARPVPFVVVESDDGRLALGVDKLLGQQEAVLKAVMRPLDLVPGLSGVTILGNGRPVFVLDVARLVAS